MWRCIGLALLFVSCNLRLVAYGQDDKSKVNAPAEGSGEAFVIEESIDRYTLQNDGTATRDASARVHLQSDAGVQRYGLLTFPYLKAIESVDIEYVRVRKPDGSTVSTPLDDVQDMPSNVTREAPFYSDLREKHVAVKTLSSGDTLEYQCHWRQTKSLAPGQFWLNFNFSHDEVVLKQQLQVSVPRDRAVKVKTASTANLTPVITEAGNRRVYTWTGSNLQPKKESKTDLAQRAIRGRFAPPDILLSSFQTWDEVGSWYYGLQQDRIEPNKEIRDKAAELTRNAPDQAAKILAIYKYVSTEFRYIGVAFGVGRYQPHAAAEVLSNQYGDCKDKHTLLASLLAAAGITAYPALISSAHVVDQDVPSPLQFDHVISAIPQGKDILWLDTTAEVAPLGYLFAPLRDKPALVISSQKTAQFQNTPAELPFPSSWTFKITAKLDDSGTLEGKVEQAIRGDREVLYRAALRSLSRTQWKDLVQQVSYSTGFAGDVSDVDVSQPEATEAPLRITYTYKRKDYPDWKEHRISFPAPSAIGAPPEEDGKLPSSFWLGPVSELQFESRVELPAGFVPDLPKNKDLVQDFAEYHSSYSTDGNVLIARYRILVKKTEVSGAAVKDYKTFADKAAEDRDQYISLSSGKSDSIEEAGLRLRKQIWNLPDSKNSQALEAEKEARSAMELGSPQGAVASLKQAVSLDPGFTRAWVSLAQIYMASRQKEAALDAFQHAVGSDPEQVVPYKLLAFALAVLGRRDEAIKTWEKLKLVTPNDADVDSNIGLLLNGEERYPEAVPYLESAVKMYPQRSNLFAALGTAYLHVGDDEKSKAAFDKSLQLDPGARNQNEVAYALAEANKRLDDALLYSEKAVQEEEEESRKIDLDKLSTIDVARDGRLAANWDTLGWVHFKLHNLKPAESYLYAAWMLMPSPTIGYHLAQVYEKQLRKADAVHLYRLLVTQTARAPEDVLAIKNARQRLENLHAAAASGPVPMAALTGGEMSENRTVTLPRLVSQHANAEFFVLFGPGATVEDTRFISGSDSLRTAGKALRQAHFKVAFPEKSSGRLLRRGILACYPTTGCSFALFALENTRVE